jgi:ATP adenylyltransferase
VEHAPEQGAFAGVPDAWARLYVPHRLAYLRGESRPSTDEAGDECPFCRAPSLSDKDGLIVARGEKAFVVLNLYPYNAGHVLICPYRHVADYTELTLDEVAEIGLLTQKAMIALRAAAGPHGFNIGINQGAAGGAGIAAHLHQHVVPRWGGDSNFLPVIGGTKTVAMLLEDTRDLVAAAWPTTV